MKLSQLRILVCASRHLNISGAAAELGMSQPAVSLQMRKLQEEFGVEFYRANNRGIELTREGTDFASAVQPLVDRLALIEHDLKSAARDHRARLLTVGATHTLTEAFLLDNVSKIRERYPGIRLSIETQSSDKIEHGVRSGTIDIGLISGPSYFPECEYQAFRNQELVAFVPPYHELAGAKISLAELMGHPLVMKKDGTCTRRLLDLGYMPTIALECAAADGLKSAVAKGFGVGLLFRARLRRELERKEFALLSVSELRRLARKSFLVTSKRRMTSKAAKDFLASLRRNT